MKTLSEGQKGLLSLTCLCMQRRSILILDEPTNHINFRHLPALASAVPNFEGAVLGHLPACARFGVLGSCLARRPTQVLIVSHDSNFLGSVVLDRTIDMGKKLRV